jgi:hypothetical protein
MDDGALDSVAATLARQGWILFERVLAKAALKAIRADVLASVADCGARQVRSGAACEPDGTAHHAVGAYASLDAFLEHLPLRPVIERYFGAAPYILHAFNPATVAPEKTSYLHRIHRDVRTHAGGFHFLLNMLVMVDDFTLENGATHVLSGSHTEADPPVEARFWRDSERLVGPAGSIVLFDSNLWHAAGTNTSGQVRAALTLSLSRAFVKQQMDYPRFLGEAWGRRQSSWMRQLLGYNAMTPTSYEEFYRPRDQRLYHADQG